MISLHSFWCNIILKLILVSVRLYIDVEIPSGLLRGIKAQPHSGRLVYTYAEILSDLETF